MNDDYDRYDFILSIVMGLLMAGIVASGGPLWAVVLVGMVCCTIVLYRHLPLPPRRKR
jgi:hypothetical protein